MKEKVEYNAIDLVNYLKEINFIGPFPLGMEVLLCPLESTLQESKGLYPDISKTALLNLLRKEGIFVFKSAEEYGEVLKQARKVK